MSTALKNTLPVAPIKASEIRRQLDLITSSPEFAGGGNSREKPKLAALLRFLVEEYIEGRVPDEYTVGIRVFDRPLDWLPQESRIVSTNLRNLRESLDNYYETEGVNDPIRVEFLKGSGCRVTISYTNRTPADIAYRRGVHNLRSFSPLDQQNAVAYFQQAIETDPRHATSYSGLAQALCNLSWYLYDQPPRSLLLKAEEAVLGAATLAPDTWETLMALGMVSLCLHRWENAVSAFERVLVLDESRTERHLWYCQYLDCTGRFGETVAKTERDFLNAPDDEYFALTHVFSLYFARRFGEAEELCRESLRLERFSFRAHGAMFLISASAGKPEQALHHALELRRIAQLDVFDGLSAMAYGMLGMRDRAEAILAQMLERAQKGYVTKFQLCAAYIGLGEFDKATEMVEGACADCDPWLMYLHMMPLLDPLRNMDRFKSLQQKMRLPYKKAAFTSAV